MKNTKNITFAIISFTALITSCAMQAVPNFEIYNKDKNPIGFKIVSQKINITGTVLPTKTFQAAIDTNLEFLGITICENVTAPHQVSIKKLQDGQSFTIKKPQGKTIYLTWNPAKPFALYPQTGPLMGLLRKTESGLSLSNNIKESQIEGGALYME